MQSFILDTPELLENFKQFVKDNYDDIDIVSFDLETDSVEEIKANIYGIGLSFQDDEGFYLPVRAKDGSLFFGAATQDAIDFVSNLLLDKKIIAHNGIYDVLVWRFSTGVDLAHKLHADTILMKHCIDENPPFGLKETAVAYLGDWADKAQKDLYESIEANGGSTTKTNLQMYKADTSILGVYCTWDVMLTFKLFNIFSAKLESEGLLDFFYEDEVMPLYREVTIPMKYHGINVDVPFFERLKLEITEDIKLLETSILSDIDEIVYDYCADTLAKMFPVKLTGSFPKAYAKTIGLEVSSLAKKAIANIETTTALQINYKNWLLGIEELKGPIEEVQRNMFFEKHQDQSHVFNLNSKAQLKVLFFDILQEDPLSTTDSGAPQVDDDFLDSIKHKYDWVKNLQDKNKLEKLKGTYIEGILDRQVNGVLRASMLQFGTTSGRYASRNPNLQNAPRPKEEDSGLSPVVLKYNNSIREGFISANGRSFVDADYSALEPRCFATASSDPNLQSIFHSGEDMYSAIAKRVFNLDGGTFKKDPDFIGKKYPEKRQQVKAFALATTYGAEAFRIGELMGTSKDEAQAIIDDYMKAYPGLKGYIRQCHYEANKQGFVKTMFGRVRHLPRAKEIFDTYGHSLLDPKWARINGLGDTRREYKNLLNNSTNFKIQGLAAHIANRAMIAINRKFKEENIDGYVCLQVHDQVVTHVSDNDSEKALDIVRSCMENVVKLPVPLVAEPKIAHNLRDSH